MTLLLRLFRASARRLSARPVLSQAFRSRLLFASAATSSTAIVTIGVQAPSPLLFEVAKQENARRDAIFKAERLLLEERSNMAGVRLRKILLAQIAPGMPLHALAAEGLTRAFVPVRELFDADANEDDLKFFLAHLFVGPTEYYPAESMRKCLLYKIIAGIRVSMDVNPQQAYNFTTARIELDWSKAHSLNDQEHTWLQDADIHLRDLPRISVDQY
jgi:hypothetical protein